MMADEQGNILVVDDNRTNRIKLSITLEQSGYRVHLAENGRQALDMLRQDAYDVMLLDLLMPEMDGFEVLERITKDADLRGLAVGLAVIVISALDDMEGVIRCIEMGAEDYLPKDYDPVLLKARISSSLQKKRLRDLERRYLQQEVALHQNEKLALLGKLSAGMAHELNNPSAAIQSGASQLNQTFAQLQQRYLELGKLHLTDEQMDVLISLNKLAQERAQKSTPRSSIIRSDQEDELENLLEQRGVQNAWEIAPTLVDLNLRMEELSALTEVFSMEHFPMAVDWICLSATIYILTEQIDEGAQRMSEIVKALKNYTYMDQAPIQNVDIHEGLESTLVILRSKLSAGVKVERSYADDLPRIEAYGSELNQVWTNLIDNAIDAMQGHGTLHIRTSYSFPWVTVEIEDDGPGIPDEVKKQIFEPFFTTKLPGKGSGMGLNISHNIIVKKHKGRLELTSQPGKTSFKVQLPLRLVGVEEKLNVK